MISISLFSQSKRSQYYLFSGYKKEWENIYINDRSNIYLFSGYKKEWENIYISDRSNIYLFFWFYKGMG